MGLGLTGAGFFAVFVAVESVGLPVGSVVLIVGSVVLTAGFVWRGEFVFGTEVVVLVTDVFDFGTEVVVFCVDEAGGV